MSSPNYPDTYPHNLRKMDIIEVEEGLVVAMQFTAFNLQSCSSCGCDHVTIKNGDGTTLMEKTCGTDDYWDYYDVVIGGQNIGPSLPPVVTSTSNRVEIYFHTDYGTTESGWRLTWRAVTPGA